ncbi:MAG: YciI family protein [Acidimicrobiia bacterium]|jgi:hypothetical protein
MSQYLMSVYYVEGEETPGEDVIQQMYADVDTLNTKMQDAGAWVFGGGLQTPDIATVVSSQDGEVLTTDGPFPEAKEQIGGFWIIEATDLDEALDWARQATVACRGPVEVRPFQDEPES